MKIRQLVLIASALSFAGCREAEEVVVEETREVTTRDEKPKLFATSDERFRNAKPSPVQGETPENWRQLPASQFRLLNYRFGESGLGEVWVTLAAGGVPDNVNRWLAQFSAEPLDEGELAAARRVPVAGTSGVWVEATGEYAAGMGAPPRPGFGLAGVVAMVGGQILTVKMVGPEAEVEAAKGDLETFAAGLRMIE